jgi:uncharacterized protein YhaN
MKKLSKEKQLKERIVELEHQVERLEKTRDDYYEKIRKYEEKKEMDRFEIKTSERMDFQYSENLKIIIRWLINPETAKTPTEEELKKMGRF